MGAIVNRINWKIAACHEYLRMIFQWTNDNEEMR